MDHQTIRAQLPALIAGHVPRNTWRLIHVQTVAASKSVRH
jgi:hypothetical protein